MIRTFTNLVLLRLLRRSIALLLFCLTCFIGYSNSLYNTSFYYFENNLAPVIPSIEGNNYTSKILLGAYDTLDKTTNSISEVVYSTSENVMMRDIEKKTFCSSQLNAIGNLSSVNAHESSILPPSSPLDIIPRANLLNTAFGSGIYQISNFNKIEISSMSCNNNVQVSLDENCEALITPDMILEGDFPDYSIFDVEIEEGFQPVNNPVSGEYHGQTLTVSIINTTTNNSCWGTVIVEDKSAPIFDCPIAPIVLNCATNITTISVPIATDNCDGIVASNLIDETTTEFSCDDASGLIRSITREYTAIDSKGNQTQTNCEQTINIERADLIDVTFPTDRTFECGTNPNTDPSSTGYPRYNGVNLTASSVCNFVSYSADDTLQVCGNGYKIIRTWTVIDWCNASSTPTSIISEDQIIKIIDTTAPSLTCPLTFDVDINESDCTADFFLPSIEISDECSNYTTQVFTPFGNITEIATQEVTGLTVGMHFVHYSVTDECGNNDDCTVTINVEDNTAPVMVCDEITQVTLDDQGTAVVSAIALDDGSYDYCTNITFEIRRMDGDDSYAPIATFGCADTEAPITVEVQATDFYGITNSCMVEVLVDDINVPSISCPENIEITCDQDYDDYFGLPSITSVCAVSPLIVTTTDDINSCDVGSATRTFTVSSSNGMTASCQQVISIINNDFLTLGDITFPADPEPFECGTSVESLAIDSLPLASQYPIIDAPACAQIAMSHEDQFLDISEPACLRILRTWTVVDWCSYDPANPDGGGIYVHVQKIDVIDNEKPFLVCPPNPFVKIINPVCDTTIFVFGPDTLTDCNPNVFLTATSVLGEGLGPFEDVPIGMYDITLIANDGCGNTSTCDYVLQVQDNKPPTPYCVESLVIGIMETGMIEVNIGDFNAGSFDNCTAPEDLLFSYSVNPFDSVQIFTCNDLGTNTIGMYVTDEGFNTDYCMVNLIIQDQMFVCGAPRTVSGSLLTESLLPVADAMLAINGTEGTESSNEEGNYSLQLESGDDYTILPSKNTSPTNGITTYDIVLIKQHILGTQLLGSPYKIIAADANRSGAVTTSDIIALKRLVLTLDTEFQNNTSWRFVDANYDFPNPANPFEVGFPEFCSMNNLAVDQENIDFVAIKIGDVNGNADGLGLTGESEERTNQNTIFKVNNAIISKGDTHTIWLNANEVENLLGLQGTISFDKEYLDFVEIMTEEGISKTDFNLNKTANGLISLSWENAASNAKNLRFGIIFSAKQTVDLSNVLSFSNEMIASEAYKSSNGNINFTGLEFSFSDINFEQFIVHQNTPNPFTDITNIAFELPKANTVNISIFDISGKVLWSRNGNFEKGLNTVEVSKKDLKTSGVLFYSVETAGVVEIKRMVVL